MVCNCGRTSSCSTRRVAPVQHLAFSQLAALQRHQPARDFRAGLQIHQPLAGSAGDLDFFLGVQPFIQFLTQRQDAAQPAPVPQWDRPDGFTGFALLQRQVQQVWCGLGRQLCYLERRRRFWIGVSQRSGRTASPAALAGSTSPGWRPAPGCTTPGKAARLPGAGLWSGVSNSWS